MSCANHLNALTKKVCDFSKRFQTRLLLVDNYVPPKNQPYEGDTYDDYDKLFFKDGVNRLQVVPAILLEDFYQAFFDNNNFFGDKGASFIDFTVDIPELNAVLNLDIAKYLDSGVRISPEVVLPPLVDLRPWAPPVYNQGLIGSCYANTASTVMAYTQAYAKKIEYGLSDEATKGFISEILPSRVYLEYIFQSWYELLAPVNVFNQSGFPNVVMTLTTYMPTTPYEINYSYPLINNMTPQQVFSYSANTQYYLVEEWIRKKVYSPTVIEKNITTGLPYYLNMQTIPALFADETFMLRTANNLFGLAQKTNGMDQLLYYDSNGNETTTPTPQGVPKYSYLERVQLYKTILSKNFAIAIGFPIAASWMKVVNTPQGIFITPPKNPEDFVGGHAVTYCGYNDSLSCPDGSMGAFIVQNSWGTSVGIDGYFYMPYTFIEAMLTYSLLSGLNSAADLSPFSTIQFK